MPHVLSEGTVYYIHPPKSFYYGFCSIVYEVDYEKYYEIERRQYISSYISGLYPQTSKAGRESWRFLSFPEVEESPSEEGRG